MALFGCGEGGESLFPLDEGWNWEYRVTAKTESGEGLVDVYRYFVANLAPVELDGRRVAPRLRADGGIEFYAETPQGVMWFGEKVPGKAFVPAPDGRLVIGKPGNSGWEAKDWVRLLRRRLAFHRSYVIDVPVTIGYGLETARDTVSVPAGVFKDCLRVKGVGRAQYDGGYDLGIVDILVETSDWYAPGVGLVKSLRRENSSNYSISYGEYVMELEAFNRGR